MTVRVSVANWTYSRRVAWDEKHIFFQVTACANCGTWACADRAERVADALKQAKASWEWADAPADWPQHLRCVRIRRQEGVEPLSQLQSQIGMQLREVNSSQPVPVAVVDEVSKSLLDRLADLVRG